MDNLNLFIRSIFIDNMIFAYFLGMCSFIAVSKNVKTAFGLGIAVTFMLTTYSAYQLSARNICAYVPVRYRGLAPIFADVDLSFLSLIVFIAVIASMTQLVEMVVEKYAPALYSQLGIFLPLIAVNCAILGGSLFMQQRDFGSVWTAVCAGGGWGLGWLLCNYRRCCRPRTYSSVLQRTRPAQRCRHHIYHHCADGYCLHELPRYQDLK